MGRNIVSSDGKFEWDEDKNNANREKHGISFEEILPMFGDPLFYEQYDGFHSTTEESRYLGMAKLHSVVVVVAVYTERIRTRIISARVSTSQEEARYEQWCKQFYD